MSFSLSFFFYLFIWERYKERHQIFKTKKIIKIIDHGLRTSELTGPTIPRDRDVTDISLRVHTENPVNGPRRDYGGMVQL